MGPAGDGGGPIGVGRAGGREMAKKTWLRELQEEAYYYSSNDFPVNSEGYVDFSIPHRQPTEIGYMILVLVDRIRHRYAKMLCRYWYKECDIEMDGYAGPDSGWESWACRRCGEGGSHTYY